MSTLSKHVPDRGLLGFEDELLSLTSYVIMGKLLGFPTAEQRARQGKAPGEVIRRELGGENSSDLQQIKQNKSKVRRNLARCVNSDDAYSFSKV